MAQMILTAGDDSLVIETYSLGWARCHLLSPAGNIFLGATDTKYVLGGLQFAVDEPEKLFWDDARLSDLFGHRARDVFALVEAIPKSFLCVSEEDEHRLLLCLQDSIDGGGFTLAHVLRLSPSDRQRWQEQLGDMRAELEAAGEKV